jgi:hypothetical protein
MFDGDYSGPGEKLIMTTAKEYRAHAKKCFIRAQETESEELRQASLEMASYWMDASMRTECLGDSRVEPEQRAENF